MKCSFKSFSGENVVMPISELHTITGRSVLMYPPRAALRSASPSDIYRWLWCLRSD